jgi:hypothetical protein
MHRLKKIRKNDTAQLPVKKAACKRIGLSHCVAASGHQGKPRVNRVLSHSMLTHKADKPTIISNRELNFPFEKRGYQARANKNQTDW